MSTPINPSENSQKALQEYGRRICQAMNFIETHLEENPSLEEIARAASFSKFHFHRIFKGVTGESVGEFTRRLRLEKAACFQRCPGTAFVVL
jgi:AraC family transcriptional regulator